MRIKVTGYLNTEDMEPEHVDESHDMGLSEEGFVYYTTELGLDDVEFEAVDERTAEQVQQDEFVAGFQEARQTGQRKPGR
jgi:hypothetical protein